MSLNHCGGVHRARLSYTNGSHPICPSNDSQVYLRHSELAGTVASFRTWRGSRRSLAQDPAISGGHGISHPIILHLGSKALILNPLSLSHGATRNPSKLFKSSQAIPFEPISSPKGPVSAMAKTIGLRRSACNTLPAQWYHAIGVAIKITTWT
jgi:hypothetical protein